MDAQDELIAEIQERYIRARELMLTAKADLDEKNYDCMLDHFVINQTKIAEIGKDLDRYGITIKYDNPIADPIFVPTPDQYDCRYKPEKKCQLPYLKTMTDEQRMGCRQTVDKECFEKTYEGNSNADLDFWSFAYFVPALFLCLFEGGFDYGLCVEKSAYILNLRYLQDELNVFY